MPVRQGFWGKRAYQLRIRALAAAPSQKKAVSWVINGRMMLEVSVGFTGFWGCGWDW